MKNEETQACRDASEFRFDPLTERWALVAEGRGKRPSNIARKRDDDIGDRTKDEASWRCPFCPGNENETTPAVATIVLKRVVDDSQDVDRLTPDDFEILDGGRVNPARRWFARVVENKYPAFRVTDLVGSPTSFAKVERDASGFHRSLRAFGRHEVLIDTNRHIRGWGEASRLEVQLVFRAFRSRLQAFRDAGIFGYAFAFKNVGENAGASQPHAHCQLTATEAVPRDIVREFDNLARLDSAYGSYWDALFDVERRAGVRIVWETERYVVYCPYASRFPGETEICPKFDRRFEDYDNEELDELATLAQEVARALERCAHSSAVERSAPRREPFDYNALLRNIPYVFSNDELAPKSLRPRWVFLPSLVKKAGFELGSGIDINPVAPETIAAKLRSYFA